MSSRGRDGDGLGPVHRGRWTRPPRRVRDRVRRMPTGDILHPARPESVDMVLPDDVRAAGEMLSDGDEIVVTRSHEKANLSVSIRPPDAEGIWRIGGRVWLLEESSARISVAVVHEDHVLSSVAVADGEYFEIEEVLPAGWGLEVHLPAGVCLRVEDPRE